ncbi:MAG TPA: trypsin-like peptidase domain-containing protein [Acidimicrobiales bacterium]|nr:trypsin-like peptidase domain-containing protein [Acidimicrobiales bacterium]
MDGSRVLTGASGATVVATPTGATHGDWPRDPWTPRQPGTGMGNLLLAVLAVLVTVVGLLVARTTASWLGASTGEPSLGAGAQGALGAGGAPASSPSGSSSAPQAAAPASGGGSPDANAIAGTVEPAVVDVTSQLGLTSDSVAGTGMVLSATGEVLTNNHVVNGATSVSVLDIGDGRTYRADVVGTDPTDDVAVLQLRDAAGLATVRLGSAAHLAVGQDVVAIGNAWGTGGRPSVTSGPIVGLDQSIAASDEASHSTEHLDGLIESRATLQPGDSGGPLVDTSGAVVGMDTAAGSATSGDGAGAGFAVPIDRALTIARLIVAGDASSTVHVGTPAYLGVQVEAAAVIPGLNVTATPGALISEVEPGSPADQAGLLPGDEIVSVNGTPVDSPAALRTLLRGFGSGDVVDVGWNDALGQHHQTAVQLVAGPAD